MNPFAMRGRGRSLLRNPITVQWGVARAAMKAVERTRILEHQVRVLEEKLSFLESLMHLRQSTHRRHLTEFGELLRPVPNGHLFERIGSTGDGGYVIPSDVPPPRTVVSIGVGHECSADDALAARAGHVWQFDHTVASSPSERTNVRFVRRGLGGAGAEGDVLPLSELLELVDEPRGDMWLMLDAEGVEWDALGDDSAPIEDFQVICIEFHMLGAAAVPELLAAMIRGAGRLAESHVPIAWSANNFAPIYAFSGVVVPDVLEVTFVAKSLFKPGTGTVPSGLYRKNNAFGPTSPTPFSGVEWNRYGATPRVFLDAMSRQSDAAVPL